MLPGVDLESFFGFYGGYKQTLKKTVVAATMVVIGERMQEQSHFVRFYTDTWLFSIQNLPLFRATIPVTCQFTVQCHSHWLEVPPNLHSKLYSL